MTDYMPLRCLCLPGAIALLAVVAAAQAPDAPPPDFTRIEFEGHPEETAAINDYLWRHFKNRPTNGNVLFNQEYLTIADMWLNANDPHNGKPIQQIHRDNLLSMQFDDEGYVHTHQHFSHAHDEGWPFPVWPQAGKNPGDFEGITAGWLFQEQPDLQGWAAGYLQQKPELAKYYGTQAAASWSVKGGMNSGIVNKALEITPDPNVQPSVLLSSPEGMVIDAFNAPYLQIRWTSELPATDNPSQPWLRWVGDSSGTLQFDLSKPPSADGYHHTILPLYKHPAWTGKIYSLEFAFPEKAGKIRIDSIFTCYDTRHTINNPIFILASKKYFEWTGDFDFLRRQINRMRLALQYMRINMKGAERDYIRVEWPGHDGLPGFRVKDDGSKEILPGHGIGNNYWDLMPFGWDDFYATFQYYSATHAMATLEQLIAERHDWNIPGSTMALPGETLFAHAESIKVKANELFWNEATGRYYASIDKNGTHYDYGYTFLNLEAICSGIVPDDRAKLIMDWISGKRIVEGDTSTGADIYHWRFGPRATTRRNVEWYGQGWYAPEGIEWGKQVQDGGAVLGFTYYDLMARLKVYGHEDAWQRLKEILTWDKEVQAAGGYRAYYADGSKGNTLQGCGTPGGLGIDCEFYESSMLPAFVIDGLAGIGHVWFSEGDRMMLEQKYDGEQGLPQSLPPMKITNVRAQSLWTFDIRLDGATVSQQIAGPDGSRLSSESPFPEAP